MKNNLNIVLVNLVIFSFALPPLQSMGAEQKSSPHLIDVGSSIGKVQLGQSQESVRQEMGQPAKSEVRRCVTITHNQPGREKRTIVGNLNVDTWLRTVSPEDKKRPVRNGHPNFFTVFYDNNKVVQITTTLDGYQTKEGLSVLSSFQDFSKQYDKVDPPDVS